MKKICGNRLHYMVSSRGGRCAKVRGDLHTDSVFCSEYDEHLKIRERQTACSFYEDEV